MASILPRDALLHVLTACVSGADSGAGALQSLAAAAGVCRAWFFAARDEKHWRLLAVRLWPAAATFERAPTGGWRCFVRARTLAERRGVTSDSPKYAWMLNAGDLPLDRYLFFLDVFDADSGALVTSAQLRTPAACGHVLHPCDDEGSCDDEHALDAVVAASDVNGEAHEESASVQHAVALPVPVTSWPPRVSFRVLALRTADGALAQVMHAAAVPRGVFNGNTKEFTVPPSEVSPTGGVGADEDEGEDDGTRVAQGSHFARDTTFPPRSHIEASVQVFARGSVAALAVECQRSRNEWGVEVDIDHWTKALPCLVWAAPPPARAPAFFEAAEGTCADGVMPPDVMQLLARHLAALTPAELAAAACTQSAWRDVMLAAGAPALAQHLDADPAAAGFSWRGLAAQLFEAQRRPSSWQAGEVDSLSDLTFVLEASCFVNGDADADDNETVPGARRLLLYSGAFRIAQQPSARSPGEYEFAGGAENALVATASFRPFCAAEQLPVHLASALPVWASMDDAISWLDGAAAMRGSLYAVRASDGAVAQLSSERTEDIWADDSETTLDLMLTSFATCRDGVHRLGYTARHREQGEHVCRLGNFVSLIWPAAPPQLPRGAQVVTECPRADIWLYEEIDDHFQGSVEFRSHELENTDVLHALAHADWQLPVA